MPTIGVTIDLTLADDKTRSTLARYNKGIPVEQVIQRPYVSLQSGESLEIDLTKSSFIVFLADVFGEDSPFDLDFYTTNTVLVPDKTVPNDLEVTSSTVIFTKQSVSVFITDSINYSKLVISNVGSELAKFRLFY